MSLIKKDGSPDLIDEPVFAALFRPYSVMNGGDTEFIFLNACKTSGYGMRLNRMGFEGACAMSGGFKAWKAAGGPIGL